WKGATGNDITIIANYLGLYGGEALPTNLTLTIVPMAGGTGEPNFTSGISAIQVTDFDYVGLPYTDTASMAAWAIEFGFSQSGRWSYTRQQYGMVLGAYRNDYADALTWGLAQNAPVLSTLVIEQTAPSPVWEWSAAYCALAALGFSDDPARPLQTLEMPGILPAQIQNRFLQAQLNALTNSGLAIQATAPDGNPMILREQTQYQVNSYGQADTAFGLLTVLATLQELLRRMKSAITSKYPRVKLVPDGTRLGPGQAAVTPTDIKGELIAEFALAEFDGLVADLPDFKANLVVAIDDNNPNKIQVLWPPQLAGQLRQLDALAQFRLLYPPVAVNS
ncbi:MAG: phage tail sheath subtilisin-like domain-containing protein, partial [Xanthobacteraceae bacterium]